MIIIETFEGVDTGGDRARRRKKQPSTPAPTTIATIPIATSSHLYRQYKFCFFFFTYLSLFTDFTDILKGNFSENCRFPPLLSSPHSSSMPLYTHFPQISTYFKRS